MLFNNSRVRRRLVVRNPMTIKIALPLDDHRKLEAFVALLAQIDKRNRTNGKDTKARDPTKAKDALTGQYKKARKKSGPIFLKQILYSCKNFITTSVYKGMHHEKHLLFSFFSF